MTVKLFGAFRDVVPAGQIHLNTALPVSTKELKIQLAQSFRANPRTNLDLQALLTKSVLATETRVLAAEDLIEVPETLALLPPVCGG